MFVKSISLIFTGLFSTGIGIVIGSIVEKYFPKRGIFFGTGTAFVLVGVINKLQDHDRKHLPSPCQIPEPQNSPSSTPSCSSTRSSSSSSSHGTPLPRQGTIRIGRRMPIFQERRSFQEMESQFQGRKESQDCVLKSRNLSYELRCYFKKIVDDYVRGLRLKSSELGLHSCPYEKIMSGYKSVSLPDSPFTLYPSGSTRMNYRPINMPEIVTWGAGSSRLTVKNLRIRLKYSCVLGLDCEWKPETRRGERNEVALLQLAAADGYCVVYRLSELEEVPRDVKELLSDTSVIKTGVGIENDVRRLSEDYGVDCKPFLDLRFMAVELGYEPVSLKKLSKRHLGRELSEDYFTNWEKPELNSREINYAADDAWASVDLFVIFSYLMFKRRGEEWANNLSGTLEIFNDCMNKNFCFQSWRREVERRRRYVGQERRN